MELSDRLPNQTQVLLLLALRLIVKQRTADTEQVTLTTNTDLVIPIHEFRPLTRIPSCTDFFSRNFFSMVSWPTLRSSTSISRSYSLFALASLRSNNEPAPSSSSFFHWLTYPGCTSCFAAISFTVSMPFKASSAIMALNSAVSFLLCRLMTPIFHVREPSAQSILTCGPNPQVCL